MHTPHRRVEEVRPSMKWSDVSSRRDGAVWEAKCGVFWLQVHRHIHYPPDVWLASCRELFQCIELKSRDLGKAKIEAKRKLVALLEKALQELNN
jgi:hypothetical protein